MPTFTRQRWRASELERELTMMLDLTHTWGAAPLLDKADVVLEARTTQDIHRNALVSIFLKLLEYFHGTDPGALDSYDSGWRAAFLYIYMYRVQRGMHQCCTASVRGCREILCRLCVDTN